jgi:hypothetical protein
MQAIANSELRNLRLRDPGNRRVRNVDMALEFVNRGLTHIFGPALKLFATGSDIPCCRF